MDAWPTALVYLGYSNEYVVYNRNLSLILMKMKKSRIKLLTIQYLWGCGACFKDGEFALSLHGKREERISEILIHLFYKHINLIHKFVWFNHFFKVPLLNAVNMDIKFQCMKMWRTCIFRLHYPYALTFILKFGNVNLSLASWEINFTDSN